MVNNEDNTHRYANMTDPLLIQQSIKELISKLYSKNDYQAFGAYDYKPVWIDYDFQNIIPSVIDQIKTICKLQGVESEWDRHYYSSFEIFFSIPPFAPRGNYQDFINFIKKANGQIYEFWFRISILGPFATPIDIGNFSLISEEKYQVEYMQTRPEFEHKDVIECIEKVLKKNNIYVIPKSFLTKKIEGMTGHVHFTNIPPSIFNCIFGDRVYE